ncbi:uncharacterized protein V6R79_006426 [Siganus canaliculatus]
MTKMQNCVHGNYNGQRFIYPAINIHTSVYVVGFLALEIFTSAFTYKALMWQKQRRERASRVTEGEGFDTSSRSLVVSVDVVVCKQRGLKSSSPALISSIFGWFAMTAGLRPDTREIDPRKRAVMDWRDYLIKRQPFILTQIQHYVIDLGIPENGA